MADENILLALHLFAEDYRRKAAMLTRLEDMLRELIDKDLEREESNET